MPWNGLYFLDQKHLKQIWLDLRNQNISRYLTIEEEVQQDQGVRELFLSRVILEDLKPADSYNLLIFIMGCFIFSTQCSASAKLPLSSKYSLINRKLSLTEARMKTSQQINHCLIFTPFLTLSALSPGMSLQSIQ